MTSEDPDDNRQDATPHDAGLPAYTDVTADAAPSAGGPAVAGGGRNASGRVPPFAPAQ